MFTPRFFDKEEGLSKAPAKIKRKQAKRRNPLRPSSSPPTP